MTDYGKEKLVRFLKLANKVLFCLQGVFAVILFCAQNIYRFPPSYWELPYIFVNEITLAAMIIFQILFVTEIICLQHYFSESDRKKLRKICFAETVVFIVFGYLFYLAAIF